jgi:hypothetical protein
MFRRCSFADTQPPTQPPAHPRNQGCIPDLVLSGLIPCDRIAFYG